MAPPLGPISHLKHKADREEKGGGGREEGEETHGG